MEPPRFATLKMVIRCADYTKSRAFYTGVLRLPVVEEWEEPQGRGCVMRIGDALLEFYEMTRLDSRFKEEFRRRVPNDKLDLQLKTEDLAGWVRQLSGAWDFRGPEILPWGQKWAQLRDPDGLLIALYEDVHSAERKDAGAGADK